MSKKIILTSLFILFSCSHHEQKTVTVPKKEVTREFSQGEVILASQLLTRIFDKEMAPLSCVPESTEASLLLRTIRPRMDVIQDDLEAVLDDQKEVDLLIQRCDQNCTCHFIDDLLREHQVVLKKDQKKSLDMKKTKKELNRCLTYVQNTFCQSDLFNALKDEKTDFSFDE